MHGVMIVMGECVWIFLGSYMVISLRLIPSLNNSIKEHQVFKISFIPSNLRWLVCLWKQAECWVIYTQFWTTITRYISPLIFILVQEPITRSHHLPYKPYETTFARIFLFLETVALLDWRALYAIQYNIIQYDTAQHNLTQNNTIKCRRVFTPG